MAVLHSTDALPVHSPMHSSLHSLLYKTVNFNRSQISSKKELRSKQKFTKKKLNMKMYTSTLYLKINTL